MTQLNSSSSKLSADDRYELAAVAQNQERTNNPKHLILMGVFIVVISLIVLALAWRSKSAAIEDLDKKSRELAQINQLIEDIQRLEAEQETNPLEDINQPIPDIFSQFTRYATQAKLSQDIGFPSNSNSSSRVQPMLNSTRITYPYSVRNPSLASLLDWVNISTEQIPGLGIQELTLKPESQNWLLKVTYVRYERKE
tara:strand:+ start:74562 stop:75152 length:591 start_codon:yes stop_codon:yes gene_type:complete